MEGVVNAGLGARVRDVDLGAWRFWRLDEWLDKGAWVKGARAVYTVGPGPRGAIKGARVKRTWCSSSILMFFQLENALVWFFIPVAFGMSFILVKKRKDLFGSARDYFLKAGLLITVLFMLEPVFASVQQNLKPVPTIPTSSIINQQNFLLLGVLVLLVLGGYVWKEKSRS